MINIDILLRDIALHDKETEERKYKCLYKYILCKIFTRTLISIMILVFVTDHVTLASICKSLPPRLILYFSYPGQEFQEVLGLFLEEFPIVSFLMSLGPLSFCLD